MQAKIADSHIQSITNVSLLSAYQISQYTLPEVWLDTQGRGIKVAVLDTGCDTNHQDLRDNILPGYNMVDRSEDVYDDHGHGTHVSGIICCKNRYRWICGVAPQCKVVPVQVLNSNGGGTYRDIIDGIYFAIEQDCDIINMSLYMSVNDPALYRAIREAYNKNISVICSSGNFGEKDHEDVVYPSRYTQTISVGAIDSNKQKAGFSNTGVNLDFVAPGVEIISTFPNNQYKAAWGTSFSCPWLSGVVALMLSKHRFSGGRTPINNVEDVREHLKRFAVDLGSVGKDIKYGYGLIDVQSMIGGTLSESDMEDFYIYPHAVPRLPKMLKKPMR
jgi:major intracellular serine protease